LFAVFGKVREEETRRRGRTCQRVVCGEGRDDEDSPHALRRIDLRGGRAWKRNRR
jgi:hypothetical protein